MRTFDSGGRAAGAVTSRRECGGNGSARAAISHCRARQSRPARAFNHAPRSLLRRADANRDQRCIRGAGHRPARRTSFTEELRLIARRAAIGGNQDLVVLTLYRAPGNAVRPDNSDTRTGRTGWAFFALWPGRTRRTGRADRTGIALGTGWSGWAGIALRTFATAGQADEQCHCERQMRNAHGHILQKDGRRNAIPQITIEKIKLERPMQG